MRRTLEKSLQMPKVVEPRYGNLPDETGSNGCFETMRVYRKKVFRLDAHLDRLYASAKFLGTAVPKREDLRARLLKRLKQSQLAEAVLRVALIPRSDGSLGNRRLFSSTAPQGLISIVVQPVILPPASVYRQGVHVAVVPTRKFPVSIVDPQAKYSARLGSVLAIMDAQLRTVDEALFTDATGYVTESTASNFGIIRKGAMFSSPCWVGLLSGITRDVLREIAQSLDVPFHEVPLTRHDLYVADEAFLSSTLKEILPVVSIDGRRIGTGWPGPISRALHRAFRELIRSETHRAQGCRG